MTVVALSSEEFTVGEFSFSRPALRRRLIDQMRGSTQAQLESLVLIDRDEEVPELCRGGLVVPQSPGKIITAAWPVAESLESEDRLLEGYAAAVAGMSPPRTATLLSELEVVPGSHGNRGPFVPLTEIVRYRLTGLLTSSSGQDSLRDLRWQTHSPDEQAAIEILQTTEEDSSDIPEFLRLMSWPERLAEYQSTSPRSALLIAGLSDRESPVGAAVWSVDPATRESELHYLGVLPAVRGHGWGKKILQRVCSQSRERGADSVALNVDVRNHVAIRLYESAGFRADFRKLFWIIRDNRSFSTGSTHGVSESSDF